MYRFDFNFSDVSRADDNNLRAADIDYESDGDGSDTSDTQAWASLDRRLLHRISTFLPRQRDLRTFCLVNKDWAQAAAPQLWAYPQFSEPEQLAGFLRTVSARPQVYGPHIRGIRFTLNSHYDRHLVSPFYHDGNESDDAELPTLLEVAQGKHVLSTDPTLLRSLLHGSDLTSPPLAFKFARACSPIDSLSMYGFRLRDKHVVNELMRWRLRDIEIIGMPRKQLANLGYLLHNLRSLRSLRLESDSPLPTDTWGPLALRLPALRQLRIWAPEIAASRLVRSLAVAPKQLQVLHLVGTDGDAGDDLVELIMQGSPQLQSLVVYGANITAQSAYTALTLGHNLTHLELMRDGPELSDISTRAPDAVPIVTAAGLNTLSLRSLAVDDALIAATALVATQLRTLFICGAPCLGGGSVGALLNASTRLVALGLHDCPLLTEDALHGLVSGPSADQLRVLLVSQCRMQSDGVERALPALTRLKHLTIIGTETVQQLFTYGFEESAPAAEDEPIAPPTISRSFKTTYPPDHYFCKSDPEVAAVSSDVARDIAASAAVPVPQTPRSAWNTYSTKRFVPGLLAFASSGTAYASRARADTISTEDQVSGADDAQSSQRRLRSISELPSSVAPITIHDGSDYAPSPQSEHSADFSPMDRAVSPGFVPVASEATARGLNLASDVEETTAHTEEEPTTESDAETSSAAVAAGVVGAALAAGAAIVTLNAAEDTSADVANSVEADEPAADLDARSVEEAIAEAVADSIAESSDEPVARSVEDVVTDAQAEAAVDVESAAKPVAELELDPTDEQPAPIDSLVEVAAPAEEEPVAGVPVALVDEPVDAVVEETAPVVDETVAPVQEDIASVDKSSASIEEPAAVVDVPITEDVTEEPVVSAENPATVSDAAVDKSREIEVPTALEETPVTSAEDFIAVNEEPAVEDPVVAAIVEEPAPASELVAEEVTSAAEEPAVIDDSPVPDAEVTESTVPAVDEAVPRALYEIIVPGVKVATEPTDDVAAPAEEAPEELVAEDVVSESAEPEAEDFIEAAVPVEEPLVTAEADLPIESVDELVAPEVVVNETSIAVVSNNDNTAPTELIVVPAVEADVDNSEAPATADDDSAPIARELVVDVPISPETAEDPVTVVSEQDTVIPASKPIDDSAAVDDAACVDDAADVVESPAVPTEASVEVVEELTLASSDEPVMAATEETVAQEVEPRDIEDAPIIQEVAEPTDAPALSEDTHEPATADTPVQEAVELAANEVSDEPVAEVSESAVEASESSAEVPSNDELAVFTADSAAVVEDSTSEFEVIDQSIVDEESATLPVEEEPVVAITDEANAHATEEPAESVTGEPIEIPEDVESTTGFDIAADEASDAPIDDILVVLDDVEPVKAYAEAADAPVAREVSDPAAKESAASVVEEADIPVVEETAVPPVKELEVIGTDESGVASAEQPSAEDADVVATDEPEVSSPTEEPTELDAAPANNESDLQVVQDPITRDAEESIESADGEHAADSAIEAPVDPAVEGPTESAVEESVHQTVMTEEVAVDEGVALESALVDTSDVDSKSQPAEVSVTVEEPNASPVDAPETDAAPKDSVEPTDVSVEEVAAPAAETSEPEAPAAAVDESPDLNKITEDTEPATADKPVEPEHAENNIAAEDTASTRGIPIEVQDDAALVSDKAATELPAADQVVSAESSVETTVEPLTEVVAELPDKGVAAVMPEAEGVATEDTIEAVPASAPEQTESVEPTSEPATVEAAANPDIEPVVDEADNAAETATVPATGPAVEDTIVRSVEEAAVESVVAEPTVEEAATDTAIEDTVVEIPFEEVDVESVAEEATVVPDVEPTVEDAVVEPVAELSVEEVIETAIDEESIEPAVEEAVVETAVEDTAVEQAIAEPVVEEAAAEPVVEEAAVEAAVEPVTERSVESAVEEAVDVPTVEEAAIIPAVESAVEEAVVEPAVEDVVECSVETAAEEPTVDTATKEAAAESVVEEAVIEPSVEPAVDEAVVEPAFEQAAVESPVERSVESAAEEVAIESAVEEAVAEPAVEEAVVGLVVDKTVVESAVEPTVEEAVVEHSVEPAAERSVEPTAESVVLEEAVEPVVKDAAVEIPAEHLVEEAVEPAVEEAPIVSAVEPAVDSAVEEAVAESADKEAAVEPAVDEAVVQPSVEPVVEEAVVQPFAESAVEEAVVEHSVDSADKEAIHEPSVDLSVEETAEPAVQEAVEPVIEKATVVPIVEESTIEPTVEDTVVERSVEPAVEEASVGRSVEETVEDVVEEAVAESSVESAVEDTADEPAVEESPVEHVDNQIAERSVVETAVEPTTEEATIKPVVEEAAVERSVEETAVEPAVERFVEDPVEDADKPVVDEAEFEPAAEPVVDRSVEEAAEAEVEPGVERSIEPTAEFVVEEEAVEPVVESVVEESATVPAVESAAERSVEETAVVPVAEDTAVEPVILEEVVEPAVEDTAAEPLVEDAALKISAEHSAEEAVEPAAEEAIVDPAVERFAEDPVEPVVQEEAVESVVEATVVEPAVEEAAKEAVESTAEEAAIEPVVEGAAAEIAVARFVDPAVEDTAVELALEPVVEETAVEPVVEETAVERSVEEAVEPTVKEVAAEPVVEEAVVEPAVESIVDEAAVGSDVTVEETTEPANEETVSEKAVDLSAELEDTEGQIEQHSVPTADAEPVGDVQDTSIKPAPSALSGSAAEMAAGLSLGLAATGASLAALGISNEPGTPEKLEYNDHSTARTVEDVVSLPEDGPGSIAGSEPEVIDFADSTGFESSSPYEFVDGVDRSAVGPDTPDGEAAPASESASRSLDATEHSPREMPTSGSLSPMVPEEHLASPEQPGSNSERIAPVVIGTIEAVSPAAAVPAQETADVTQDRTEPEDADDLESSREIAELVRSMTSPPERQISTPVVEDSPVAVAPVAESPVESTRSISDSPLSQVSYDRPDSQASQMLDTSMVADGAADRSLSKRDSAISMGKQKDEQDDSLAVVDDELGTVPTDAHYQATPDQAVPTSDVTPALSSFSTPAFPQYFSHPEVQQQLQEQGAGIQRREVPRASEVSKPKSGRSKEVLMELNIETPYDGRQTLQLRAKDNIDAKCEEFCAMYNMADLLPGMKTLVRGKVERRLARRRERALQMAAAKGKQAA